MKPTVGRIVHYTNLGDRDGKYPPEIQAAIITKVHHPESFAGARDPVSMTIFYPTGVFLIDHVERAPDDVAAGTEAARGKWQWPERNEP